MAGIELNTLGANWFCCYVTRQFCSPHQPLLATLFAELPLQPVRAR
jgi:hypothetical protein